MIRLTPYNPNWPQAYLQESAWLKQQLGDVIADIQHIGSTSIGGIQAKPVIDILIGVHNLDRFNQSHIQKLITGGYDYINKYEKDLPFRRYFQKEDDNGARTHQIHLVNMNSAWWFRHILFRDYMRRYPAQAKVYETLKLKLAPQFTDSNQYAFAKSEYIEDINKLAYFDWTIHKPFALTKRLQGHIVEPACLDDFCNMHHNPDFIACYGVELSHEKINTVLTKDVEHWDQYQFGPMAWFENITQQFVGKGGLRHITLLNKPETELAYALMPGFWGQGLAMQIGQYALDLAFNKLQLDNVICFTSEDNKQSLRVIEKLGFTYEQSFDHCDITHHLHRLSQSTYFDSSSA
ncbi:MAG: bifunctional GrpB family protein/GNAT family N-acetyltransferase [Coxiellaceae bacterium]|nr:bifunctional GrpB family protein/GNAT family N-acetyltransferase [Coxiellaceae bacterium]